MLGHCAALPGLRSFDAVSGVGTIKRWCGYGAVAARRARGHSLWWGVGCGMWDWFLGWFVGLSPGSGNLGPLVIGREIVSGETVAVAGSSSFAAAFKGRSSYTFPAARFSGE